MGDIFFVLRMAVYTTLIILVMQIKVGPTTLEEKVTDWTHRSEFSMVVREVAEGAVSFLGIGYNRAVQNINSSFSKYHSSDQIPGQRLKKKMEKVKTFFKETFDDSKKSVEESTEEFLDSEE